MMATLQIPTSEYHSFSYSYNDFLFMGLNGNKIELYGIGDISDAHIYRNTLKDMGSKNYLAQGHTGFLNFGWTMYAYGSGGKLIVFNHCCLGPDTIIVFVLISFFDANIMEIHTLSK
jgi:hypothetical protein